MSIVVSIAEGPLAPARQASPVAGAGADVVFEGLVRGTEGGQPIAALDYEGYRPMADRQLESVCREVLERHGLLRLECEHSVGRVPVGRCSFRLRVWAAHRAPALAGMDEFIDRLKRDVPIWKHPVWGGAQG